MSNFFKAALLFAPAFWLTNLCQAQSAAGIRFVAIPFTPEAVAFTEASAAAGSPTIAFSVNPALQATLGSGISEARISQSIWPDMQSTSYLGAAFRQGKSTWGFSLLSNLIDGMEARSGPGASEGEFSARYTAVAATWARRFGPVAAGVSGTLLNESIYEASAGGYAFSAGLQTALYDNRIRLGAALLHNGRMNPLRSVRTPLPLRWQAGTWIDAIRFTEAETGWFAMLLSLKSDVIVPLENRRSNGAVWPESGPAYVSAGAELQLDERFVLRGGWRSDDTTRPWAFGAGLKNGHLTAAYAFTRQQAQFGAIHTVGLTLTF